MNKKWRLIIGSIVVVGLALTAGYMHYGHMLHDNKITPPAASTPNEIPKPVRVDAKDANPNRYRDGWPALVEAAYRGDLDEVKSLIEHGADVNIKAGNDWTALHQAAGNGHAEVMQVLIDAGANIHTENKSRNNARDLAEERGYDEIARSLYDQGVADDAVRDFITLNTMNILDQVEKRLKKGHDPNRVDHKGRSALFYLLCTDWDRRYNKRQFVLRPEIIKVLLENGADPNLPDSKGKTPMTAFLTEYGLEEEVFDLLLDYGARLDVIDHANQSLLHSSRSFSITGELIELGLDVNMVNAYGSTPLHYHARSFSAATVGLLIKHGADPEAPDKHGKKPIDLILTSPDPGSRQYENWKATYDLLLQVSQPTEQPE